MDVLMIWKDFLKIWKNYKRILKDFLTDIWGFLKDFFTPFLGIFEGLKILKRPKESIRNNRGFF